MDRHSFIFGISKLQELVEKHTSYTGKMRVTDKDPDASDRLSMTKGENFLFEDYLPEAAAETYDWIKAFGRNVPNAFRVIPSMDLNVIKQNSGVTIKRNSINYGLKHEFAASDITPTIETPQSGSTYTLKASPSPEIQIAVGDATSVKYKIRIGYTVSVPDTPFASHYVAESAETTISSDITLSNPISLTATIGSDILSVYSTAVISSIDSLEVEVTDITPASVTLNKGDYVKYMQTDGVTFYGMLAANWSSTSNQGVTMADISDTDQRDSVIMTIELLDWQDRNMLPAVQNYLQEAMVNYIIYRWFEDANPKESERYYGRFEDKAHKAQLGLNTEAYILKRHGHAL